MGLFVLKLLLHALISYRGNTDCQIQRLDSVDPLINPPPNPTPPSLRLPWMQIHPWQRFAISLVWCHVGGHYLLVSSAINPKRMAPLKFFYSAAQEQWRHLSWQRSKHGVHRSCNRWRMFCLHVLRRVTTINTHFRFIIVDKAGSGGVSNVCKRGIKLDLLQNATFGQNLSMKSKQFSKKSFISSAAIYTTFGKQKHSFAAQLFPLKEYMYKSTFCSDYAAARSFPPVDLWYVVNHCCRSSAGFRKTWEASAQSQAETACVCPLRIT